MFTARIVWNAASTRFGKAPSIYAALKTKLGREPTNDELKNEVIRILQDARNEAQSIVRKK